MEEARAQMLELFPDGFEEIDGEGTVELVAYTDPGGEERLWHTFGGVRGDDVEDGWEDAWRRFHRPVRVGRLWVGPPWETPDADAVAVVIDPGRAFGTGAHPTTRLCLELLVEQPRGSLLDVGSGSGVLAIAGAKLGFAPVVAVDVEEPGVVAARENARSNGVEIDVRLVDALLDPLPPADVAVANIALAVVESLAPRVDARRLVTSGYLASETPRLDGWTRVGGRAGDGWRADVFERA